MNRRAAFRQADLTRALKAATRAGLSKSVTVPTNTFLTATGNNLTIVGDMTRRVVMGRLNAGVERPELREFDFEPVQMAKDNRVKLVVAALTILLAYKAEGSPPQAKPLGSFEGWSRMVRDALIWRDCGDPVKTMEQAREKDPRLHELSEVLAHWKAALGVDGITVRRIIEKATRQSSDGFGNLNRERASSLARQQGWPTHRRGTLLVSAASCERSASGGGSAAARRRLGGPEFWGLDVPFPDRPRYMRVVRYEALQAKVDASLEAHDRVSLPMVQRWLDVVEKRRGAV
ncbi:MAG: hypothetical protein ACRYGP_10525 [Janthinobacterium lividum]